MTNKDQVAEALRCRLQAHVRQLANTEMCMSMSDWNEISNDILEAARLLTAPVAESPGAEEIDRLRIHVELFEQTLAKPDRSINELVGMAILAGPVCTKLLSALDAERAARVEAEGKLAGWQPIETAPRDGTYVLGYDPRAELAPLVQVYWASDGFWTCRFGRTWMPTHWQPLPPPPKESGHE